MKKLLTLILCVFLGADASAQLFYHDINPDTTKGGGPVLEYFDFTPPSSYPSFTVFWNTSPGIYMEVHGIFGNGELLYDGSWPAKLESGDMIGPSGTWLESPGPLNRDGNGHWQTNAADKYIGFRFKRTTAASGWYYGWLKMTVAPGAASFTVKAWAYKTQPGIAIAAGDMSATAVASVSYDNHIGMTMTDKKIRFTRLRPGAHFTAAVADINGRVVHKAQISGGEAVDLGALPAGVYAILLSGDGHTYRFKAELL